MASRVSRETSRRRIHRDTRCHAVAIAPPRRARRQESPSGVRVRGYAENMAIRIEALPVSVPGLRAVRWSVDEPYVGMKEVYAIARVESGRSEFWSRGKVWTGAPGSLEIQQPGDVHRDVSRDGPIIFQVISFPASEVERVTGTVRVYPYLSAEDERGATFQRLHDAVRLTPIG